MKYVAILNTKDEFSEDVINTLKATFFLGEAEGTSYCFDIDSIKEVPKPRVIEKYSTPIELGYNIALKDCGVEE